MWLLYCLQPIGVAIARVLSFYASNAASIEFAAATRSLLLGIAIPVGVWLCLLRAARGPRKAALITSLIGVLFWSSSSIVSATEALAGGAGAFTWVVMALLWLIVLPLVAWRIARTDRDLHVVYTAADLAVATAVLVPVVTILASLPETHRGTPARVAKESLASSGLPAMRPDIYLIVLDTYGRDDELAEHFGLPDGLGHQLGELGFFVATSSNSNYFTTLQSLTSLLNYDLVQNLTKDTNFVRMAMLIRGNRFVRAVRKLGYKFVAYSTGSALTECPEADVYIQPPPLIRVLGAEIRVNEFEQDLLAWTPLDPILHHSPKISPYTRHRERILSTLADIANLTRDPDPTFVFAHIISPHEPFVFGEHGEDVSSHEITFRLNRIFKDPNQPSQPGRVGPEYARRYRAQARYLGKLVIGAVKGILSGSPEPPIIIVQSDHGVRGFSPNIHQTRFAILNAYYLPHGGERWLYPSISPVNSLRVVMNHYFGAHLPMLPDERFRANLEKAH